MGSRAWHELCYFIWVGHEPRNGDYEHDPNHRHHAPTRDSPRNRLCGLLGLLLDYAIRRVGEPTRTSDPLDPLVGYRADT